MPALALPLPLWADTLLAPPTYLQLRSLIAGGCRIESDDTSCTITERTGDSYRQVCIQHCRGADVALVRAIQQWTDGLVARHAGAT